MRTYVREDATALASEGRFGIPVVDATFTEFEMMDIAEQPAGDSMLCELQGRNESTHETDRQHGTGGIGRRDHGVALFGGQGHRLLDECVNPVLEQVHRDGRVQVMRERYDRGVDGADERAIVTDGVGNPELSGQATPAVVIQLCQSGNDNVGCFCERRQMKCLCYRTTTNYRDAD
jgi:hypothetical protein